MKVPEPRKLPSGTWFIQMRLNGVSVPVSASTKKECIRQAQLIKAEHRAGKRRFVLTDITVKDVLDEYIEKKRGGLSPSTIQGYEKIRDQYFQCLMDVPIKSIDVARINDAIYTEQARTSKRGKPLSAKTIREAWHLISTALSKKGVSISGEIDLPEVKKKPVQILSFEQIYPAIKGSSIELECLLAARLSLSMSEIRGLTKSKSIHDGKLTVVETVVDIGGNPVRKEGAKEVDRVRTLAIPDFIQTLIDEVDGDIICDKSSQTINKRYQRLLEKAGLPKSSFHKLRHTFASTGAMLQIQPEILQEEGGWHTDHTMKTVYTHTFPSARIAADKLLDEHFSKIILQNANENANAIQE